MQYADYPLIAQACIAVRDCGVLTVDQRSEARFHEALCAGLLRAQLAEDQKTARLTLQEAGRVMLRELGLSA